MYEKIKNRLQEIGLTQIELAEKLGISESTLSVKICGKSEFRQDEIRRMINIMGLSMEEAGVYFFDIPCKKGRKEVVVGVEIDGVELAKQEVQEVLDLITSAKSIVAQLALDLQKLEVKVKM